MKKFIQTSSN